MSGKDEIRHREKIAAGIVSPEEFDKRKKTLSPARVDAKLAAAVTELQKRAVESPAADPVDGEAVKREEEERRTARRADTLRRMKSPVLVQKQPDGSTRFKHSLEVSERRFGSGSGAPQ
jgi:hypothetical protein